MPCTTTGGVPPRSESGLAFQTLEAQRSAIWAEKAFVPGSTSVTVPSKEIMLSHLSPYSPLHRNLRGYIFFLKTKTSRKSAASTNRFGNTKSVDA